MLSGDLSIGELLKLRENIGKFSRCLFDIHILYDRMILNHSYDNLIFEPSGLRIDQLTQKITMNFLRNEEV